MLIMTIFIVGGIGLCLFIGKVAFGGSINSIVQSIMMKSRMSKNRHKEPMTKERMIGIAVTVVIFILLFLFLTYGGENPL